MFKIARIVGSTSASLVTKRANMPTRSFMGLFTNKNEQIAGDADQQSGRRKIEMDMAAQGQVISIVYSMIIN